MRCYETLSRQALDWSLIDLYLGDERCVPADDPDSNQRMIREVLIEPIPDPPTLHAPDCSNPESYGSLISAVGRPDVVHLGLGPDGHTASLFPKSSALDVTDELFVRNVDPSGRNPHDRLTLTYPAIGMARLVVFTVSGESKREAFGALLAGEDLPAARVRAEEVLWLVDRDAAGDLLVSS